MAPPSVFLDHRDELERSEFQLGREAGRLAVALDILTDTLALAGQHGVYCRAGRESGKPARDLQIIVQGIDQAKELVISVLNEIRGKPQS